MKQLTCEMCGSTELVKQDGFFVCQTCGTKYSVEEAKKMMIEGTVEVAGKVQIDKSNELEAFIKRIFIFLEEKKWDEAEQYCEKVLDIDPETPEAYLGKIMIEYGLPTVDDFCVASIPNDTLDYLKLVRFGNDKTRSIVSTREKNCLGVSYSDDKKTLLKVGIQLTEFEIPFGTEHIGNDAFRDGVLETVLIPDSVTTIGNRAFYCCWLSKIDIPTSVIEIGESAFSYCPLENITIPSNVKTIKRGAFDGCFKLIDIFLENGVTSIDDYAFGKDESSCETITIPDSVQNIGKYIFGEDKSELRVLNTSKRIFNLLTQKQVLDPCEKLEKIKFDDGTVIYPKKLSTEHGDPVDAQEKQKENDSYTVPHVDKKEEYLPKTKSGGCYVATCVYGSYDCPQVWTLRRFRDDTLGSTWYGRLFIRFYYAVSPTLVKWFGKTKWFKKLWKGKLDRMVAKLQSEGVEDTPYEDKNW